MSRTDKDRPYWVIMHQDAQFIDHDHKLGVCDVRTLSYDQMTNGRWRYGRNHYRTCKKRAVVSYTCDKSDPQSTCWRYYFDRHDAVEWGFRRTWMQCIGHTRIERYPDAPCVCDDFPSPPTCDPCAGTDRPRFWDGVPGRYIRAYHTKPERQRERLGLHDMAREYNANGRIDSDDFENRQNRHAARWYYW